MAGTPPYSLSQLAVDFGALPTTQPGKGGFWLDGTAVRFLPLLSKADIIDFVKGFGFYVGLNVQGLVSSDSISPGVLGTDYQTVSAADLSYISSRSKGSAVRVPFLWERMQPMLGGQLDPVALAQMKAIADAARVAGTTIILDCHNYMRRFVYTLNADGSIATTASPSQGTMYAAKGRYAVDAPDGNVTRAHLADLWSKLATYFYGHKGVAGYDIMNEPTDDNQFGPTKSGAADLPRIMQASVNAIAAVDPYKQIYVEGNSYSTTKNWVAANPGYPLKDTYGQIIYSGHCYPDYDHSGTHFSYATNANPPSGDPIAPDSLVTLSTSFVNWGATNFVKVHIGETQVGTDDPRWLTVLSNGLTYWKSKGVPVSLWYYGQFSSPEPYNMYPWSGTEQPQWAVVEQIVGADQEKPLLYGPGNGTAGAAVTGFSVQVPGYVASSQPVLLSDNGGGGTFSNVAAIQSGANPPAVTFTYTPNGTKVVSLSASVGGFSATPLPFSSDPSNPVNLLPASDRDVSNWNSAQASPPVSGTYYGATATRLSDNSYNGAHSYSAPKSYPINPGAPFEIAVVAHADSITALSLGLGPVSLDLDIANGLIGVSLLGSGSIITGGIVLPADANGYREFRIGVQLPATVVSVSPVLRLEQAMGVSSYAGAGAPVYVKSVNGYQAPIHSLAGAPICTTNPTISGSAVSGQTLLATGGTYANGTTSVAKQWLNNGSAISGATASTYTLTANDVGCIVSYRETPTNAAGTGLAVKSGGASVVGANAYSPTSVSAVKRFFTAADGTTITQSAGRVTAVSDKAGSGKPLTDAGSGAGLGYVTASSFGSAKAAFRSTPSGTGSNGRAFGSLADLAGVNVFSFMMTAAPASGQNYGRVLSVGTNGVNDYNNPGAFDVRLSSNGSTTLLVDHNTAAANGATLTASAPSLLEVSSDGTTLSFAINGAVTGTCPWSGSLAAAAQLALCVDQFGNELAFGDYRALIVTAGAVATADYQKLQGFLSWDATGSGSLLPTGHPYKTTDPR